MPFSPKKPKRLRGKRPPVLHISEILAWADEHKERTRKWPTKQSGVVRASPLNTWSAIDNALYVGLRGLPGGGVTLAKLLAERRGFRHPKIRPDLSVATVLKWADDHKRRTGQFPTRKSGAIAASPGDTWSGIDNALYRGARGLPGGGCTLVMLLAEKRGVWHRGLIPDLRVNDILRWADDHKQLTGQFPKVTSGPVHGTPREKWPRIDDALRAGNRGLPGGSSLLKLLVERRGVRDTSRLPRFRLSQILAWADDHKRRNGKLPQRNSGVIAANPLETWKTVDSALAKGLRGLPGGSSLARLLAQRRGYRNRQQLPRLTSKLILDWADRHNARTGIFPKQNSGAVFGQPGEMWNNIDHALLLGQRGLPGGSSLARLFAERRGHRNRKALPKYTIRQILVWADAHHRRTGKWPFLKSGPIREAPGETWHAVDAALRNGCRGLPGGSSLAILLDKRRGVPNRKSLPRLSVTQVLKWADAWKKRTGNWPSMESGHVADASPVTWAAIDSMLTHGTRGLPANLSLFKLLAKHRGIRRHFRHTPLSVKQILRWADAHKRRTGDWPTKLSGKIPGVPKETWLRIDLALHDSRRGLTGRTTLAKFLAVHRGVVKTHWLKTD